jgi:hypothetical protein
MPPAQHGCRCWAARSPCCARMPLASCGRRKWTRTKRALLDEATSKDPVLVAWPGQWSQDIYVVDDLRTARAAHKCKPLGSSSIRQIHFILSGAYRKAVRWRWVAISPLPQAEPPAAKKPNPSLPSTADAARASSPKPGRTPTGHPGVADDGDRRTPRRAMRPPQEAHRPRPGRPDLRTIHRTRRGRHLGKNTKQHQQRRNALDPETVTVLTEHRSRCEQRAGPARSPH